MNYNCETCNFSTNDKFNYNKHLKTSKHLKKVEVVPKNTKIGNKHTEEVGEKCVFCDKVYSNVSSLARHRNACSIKVQLVSNYEKEITHLKELNKKDQETITVLKAEVSSLKTIINNTSSVVKTSMSTMTYALKNFKDAPALEPIQNMALIHHQQTAIEFAEKLIKEYRHKTLMNYIGDIIIKEYRKTNQATQALWNSDTSRLTYVVREIIANNCDWIIDKKGVKTKKHVIDPILAYVRECMLDFMAADDVTQYRNLTTEEALEKTSKMNDALTVTEVIDDDVLAEDILKYIAPYFCLTKANDLLEV